MPTFAIAFPMIDPVAISIGPLAIRWYALAYIAGLLGGWWYARALVRTPGLWSGAGRRPTQADLDDLLVYAAVGVVLGGRLGYVLFYNLPHYLAQPAEILAVWKGGMSFHGGLLGAALGVVVLARRRGLSVLTMFDLAATVAPIGLFFGRIANFINAELWGRPAPDFPYAVVFPGGGPVPRHPSQLYEAFLEGFMLFFLLRLLTHSALKLKQPGFVAGAMIAGYGCARIFVEFFRQPDAHIGYLAGNWLTMGMILSTPMVLIGIWAMLRARSVPA